MVLVRTGIVIVGVVLLVLGLVLAFVQLVPQTADATETGSSNSNAGEYVWNDNGIILPASLTVTWTATTPTLYIVVTCSNTLSASEVESSSFNITTGCSNFQSYGASSVSFEGETLHYTEGTSGSQSVTVSAGGTLIFGGVPTEDGTTDNVDSTVTTPEPLIGLIFILLGVLLLIVGLVLRKKSPKPTAAPAQAWGAPGQQQGYPAQPWGPQGYPQGPGGPQQGWYDPSQPVQPGSPQGGWPPR